VIKIIGEIGINHNGDLEIAKRLIIIAKGLGFDYVKFQKREPDLCVPESQKNIIKDTPWGKITYLDYKKRIEFDNNQVKKLNNFCKELGIKLFCSVWDIKSANNMRKFFDMIKIPSALLTDFELLKFCRANYKKMIISTGMSTEKEIEKAVEVGNPNIIFHSNSTYPTNPNEVNLLYLKWLKDKYPDKEIGYSGHEFGLHITFAASSMGIDWIERHITLDRALWGSDHKCSITPDEMANLAKGVKEIEKSFTGYKARELNDSEKFKKETLRK